MPDTVEPQVQQDVSTAIHRAFEANTAIYPTGGGTSLGFGLPARREGLGLSTASLNRVVDYPARDMTITVEAGITMKSLAETLAKENQLLPVDVPMADRATLGGVIATNWNGPRRFGYGNIRDYVIGIHAVDGHGRAFKGGGQVVKNVAGYDFCKLLTGSLGTIGVITQVTLKVKPIPEAFALATSSISNLEVAEHVLSRLVHSDTTPSAIELLAGPNWSSPLQLVVRLDGTRSEVEWMEERLAEELLHDTSLQTEMLRGEEAVPLWKQLVEFTSQESPLTIRANVVASGTTKIVEAAQSIDPNCSIQAHAGNGVVFVSFSEFPGEGLSRTILGQLQPLATSLHGSVIVVSNPSHSEMTHQCVWGGNHVAFSVASKIKHQFDPKDILNPGRFVYS